MKIPFLGSPAALGTWYLGVLSKNDHQLAPQALSLMVACRLLTICIAVTLLATNVSANLTYLLGGNAYVFGHIESSLDIGLHRTASYGVMQLLNYLPPLVYLVLLLPWVANTRNSPRNFLILVLAFVIVMVMIPLFGLSTTNISGEDLISLCFVGVLTAMMIPFSTKFRVVLYITYTALIASIFLAYVGTIGSGANKLIFIAFGVYIGRNSRWFAATAHAAKLQRELAASQSRSVLCDLLPVKYAEAYLESHESVVGVSCPEPVITLLFSDMKGFTTLSSHLGPKKTFKLLHVLIQSYDAMSMGFDCLKIETCGDSYECQFSGTMLSDENFRSTSSEVNIASDIIKDEGAAEAPASASGSSVLTPERSTTQSADDRFLDTPAMHSRSHRSSSATGPITPLLGSAGITPNTSTVSLNQFSLEGSLKEPKSPMMGGIGTTAPGASLNNFEVGVGDKYRSESLAELDISTLENQGRDRKVTRTGKESTPHDVHSAILFASCMLKLTEVMSRKFVGAYKRRVQKRSLRNTSVTKTEEHMAALPLDSVKLRVGVATASAVSGCVGLERPQYLVLGDAVTAALIMEQTGVAQTVHVDKWSADLWKLYSPHHASLLHPCAATCEHKLSHPDATSPPCFYVDFMDVLTPEDLKMVETVSNMKVKRKATSTSSILATRLAAGAPAVGPISAASSVASRIPDGPSADSSVNPFGIDADALRQKKRKRYRKNDQEAHSANGSMSILSGGSSMISGVSAPDPSHVSEVQSDLTYPFFIPKFLQRLHQSKLQPVHGVTDSSAQMLYLHLLLRLYFKAWIVVPLVLLAKALTTISGFFIYLAYVAFAFPVVLYYIRRDRLEIAFVFIAMAIIAGASVAVWDGIEGILQHTPYFSAGVNFIGNFGLYLGAKQSIWWAYLLEVVCGIFYFMVFDPSKLSDPANFIIPDIIFNLGLRMMYWIISTDSKHTRQNWVSRVDKSEELQAIVDTVLERLLPSSVAKRMVKSPPGSLIMDSHASTTVLFFELKSLPFWLETYGPSRCLEMLSDLWVEFDDLCTANGCRAVESVRGEYVVMAGDNSDDFETAYPRSSRDSHSARCCGLAIAMERLCRSRSSLTNVPYVIKIGVNTGPLTTGPVGIIKRVWKIAGDTVNTTARYKAFAPKGVTIHVSGTTAEAAAQSGYIFTEGEAIHMKGKGLMPSFSLQVDHS